MLAAVIHENKILAVITADPAVDVLNPGHGYPEAARLVAAPEGCDLMHWTYDPVKGFALIPPDPPPPPRNRVDF
jgi:hypothetical protein